jgi:diacylglycerol kinase family enzyme
VDLAALHSVDKVLIFANPIAGRGIGADIAAALETCFHGQRRTVRKFLQRPTDVSDEELGERAGAVIVIGGDGTLRGVAQRLLRADRLAPLLPVPLGTANLVSLHLGIEWNMQTVVEQVAAAIGKGRVRLLDAGRANDQLFLLMAGVGFDAQVVYHLDRMRRGPIRFWDYLIPSAISFLDYSAYRLRVILDGEIIFPERRALAFVGNLAEYGTGFPVVPFARPDDGLLDVCVLPCKSREQLVRLFLLAAAGEHIQAEGGVYRRGRHVSIESPVEVPVQVDGDPAGHTPVHIDLLPVRLPFIVP